MIDSGDSSGRTPKRQMEGKKMQAGMASTNSAQGGAPIDARLQNEIGKHLRALYDDVISEPVPDKFVELLRQLELSTEKKG